MSAIRKALNSEFFYIVVKHDDGTRTRFSLTYKFLVWAVVVVMFCKIVF